MQPFEWSESWLGLLRFRVRFRRFGKKICQKCRLSADFVDCILLPRLILILFPSAFSLTTLPAHIARPWNIDESFPVALLMQQLPWALINRLFPSWLKCPWVSTCSSPWEQLCLTQMLHTEGWGEITARAERGKPPCLICSLGNWSAPTVAVATV